MNIRHLVIIGTGLIGGSLALALRKSGCVERITGVGRSAENLEEAKRMGVIDMASHDIATAVADADMVLVSTPVAACHQVFESMAGRLSEHAIVTDAGSTKQSVICAAKTHLSYPHRFVPAHPIAGAEHSGVKAAFASLFEKHVCVMTPDEDVDIDAVAQVQQMWESVGAEVITMSAEQHDDMLASVSHLPHLAAFALVNAVRGDDTSGEAFRFAAGGFRDFTRIASSSPEMWRDIALCNREAVMQKIDLLQEELKVLRVALQSEDADGLLQKFADAKQARDAWLAKYGEGL